MRTIVAVLASVAAMTAVAVAQTSTPPSPPIAPAAPAAAPAAPAAPPAPFTTACPALPAAPAVPDGTTSNIRQMMAAEPIIQGWSTTYIEIMACRKKEFQVLEGQLIEALRMRDASKAAYDADAAAYQTIADDWKREGEEYQAKTAGRKK